MLKLTLYEDENRPVYVRASRILSMVRGLADKGTHVKIDHAEHWVCERPEQIMAMDEMAYELHPPMTMASSGPNAVPQRSYLTTTWGSAPNVATCISQHCPNWRS